jgi:hypothetical protein
LRTFFETRISVINICISDELNIATTNELCARARARASPPSTNEFHERLAFYLSRSGTIDSVSESGDDEHENNAMIDETDGLPSCSPGRFLNRRERLIFRTRYCEIR